MEKYSALNKRNDNHTEIKVVHYIVYSKLPGELDSQETISRQPTKDKSLQIRVTYSQIT